MILGFGKTHEQLAFDVAERLALAALGTPPVTEHITDTCSIDYWHRSREFDAELAAVKAEHPDDAIAAGILIRDDSHVLVHLSYGHVRHDHPLSPDGTAAWFMTVCGWAYDYCGDVHSGSGYSVERDAE